MKFALLILLFFMAASAGATTYLMATNTSVPATSPGDTVIVTNGVWTNGITFNNANSGITVLFNSNTVFNSQCWPVVVYGGSTVSGGAVCFSFCSNMVVHGNGCIISNSACGTLFTNKYTTGICGEGINIAIDNFTVTNMVQHTWYADDSPIGGNNFDFVGTGITISNCTSHWNSSGILINCGAGYVGGGDTGGNNTMTYNDVQYCVHFLCVGVQSTASFYTNLTISHNYVNHAEPWDGNASYHCDYVYMVCNGGDLTIGYNGIHTFKNTFGPDIVGVYATGASYTNIVMSTGGTLTTNTITLQHSSSGLNACYFQPHSIMAAQNHWFSQNLILTHGDTYTNNGGYGQRWGNAISISGSNNGCLYNSYIPLESVTNSAGNAYNLSGTNAFLLGNIYAPCSGAETFCIINTNNWNGLSGCGTNLFIWTNYFGGMVSDYNIFNTNNTGNFGSGWPALSIAAGVSYAATDNNYIWGSFYGLTSWSTFNSCLGSPSAQLDPHSKQAFPNFTSGTYTPSASDNIARAQGTNLTAFASAFNVPELLTDFNGNPRPASGNWTIGAFEVNTNSTAMLFLPIRNF